MELIFRSWICFSRLGLLVKIKSTICWHGRICFFLNDLISMSTIKDKIKIEVDQERLRPIDADLQVPDTSKFKKHTGWEPSIAYEKTITDLLNYWRQQVYKNNGNYLTR